MWQGGHLKQSHFGGQHRGQHSWQHPQHVAMQPLQNPAQKASPLVAVVFLSLLPAVPATAACPATAFTAAWYSVVVLSSNRLSADSTTSTSKPSPLRYRYLSLFNLQA